MNRTEFACRMIPSRAPGLTVLDACTPFIGEDILRMARIRKWKLTVCDLAPRVPEVVQVDLTDASSLQKLNGAFHAVISCDTLEHIEDWQSALINLRDLTEKWLIIVLPICQVGQSKNLVDWLNQPMFRFTKSEHPDQIAMRHVWQFGPLVFMEFAEKIGLKVVWSFAGHITDEGFPRFAVGFTR